MSYSIRFTAFIIVFSLIFCSFTTSYAVEDQFEINLSVTSGPDVTPPSIPAGLGATAISTSQINLSWTASTDNVGVTGYRIYRDTVFLTTVVGTSYSNIGLSSATLYSYTVSAIDAANNESGQSAPATATTFTPVVTPPSGGGTPTPGGTAFPQIYDVVVTPTQTGATIVWKTTVPTIGNLAWGLTSGYEAGNVSEIIFDTNHSASLQGLVPATTYFFKIDVQSGYGRTNSLSGQSFQTLPLEQANLNPRNFVAIPQTDSVLLKWNNPSLPNFSQVRVVRNENFYPSDPSDGEVIYEGNNETFSDTNVIVGKRYYYALFAQDTQGNYSSGLVADARIPLPGEPVATTTVDIYGGLPKAPSVSPLINSLTFIDFDFIQNGKKVATFSEGSSVTIDGTKNLTVALDYRKVPELLKSVVITLHHPIDPEKTFSFLLRVNESKSAYIATIGPLGESGKYAVDISIVDYKNRGLKKINGDLFASVISALDEKNVFQMMITKLVDNILNIILLLILLIIFLKSLQAAFKKKINKAQAQEKNSNANV
jgi:hypothetical protein